MIINKFYGFLVDLFGAIFQLFPTITTLPKVGGFDIDTALVNGVGQLRYFMISFWFLQTMFQGFLVLMLYYISKAVLKFLIGHRAP